MDWHDFFLFQFITFDDLSGQNVFDFFFLILSV